MRFFIHIFCLISFLLTIDFINSDKRFNYIFLLPLSLFIFSLINFSLKRFNKSIVFKLFYIQAVIRYCIIPIGVANGEYLGHGSNSNNDLFAIICMIIELLLLFPIFIYLDNRYKLNIQIKKLKLIDKNYWLYLFIAIMFFIILFTGFFNKVNFIWELKDYLQEVAEEEENTSSLGGLLFRPFKIGILLILSSYILKLKIKKIIKLFLIIILTGISSSFIVGTSRFSILIFVVPFYFVLKDILDKKSIKIINFSLIGLLIPVVLITSIAKFSQGDKLATTDTIINTSTLNAYFAGPGNVAIGIDAFEEREIKNYTRVFINDLIQNIPILSKISNNDYKTNYIYNYKIYGHSLWQTQIVPLNISGLFHFNIIGVGFYSMVFILFASYFERKAMQEDYLPYKYAFYSIVFTLSLVFMLNIGSLIANLYKTLLFVYLPFYIGNKLQRIK